MPAALQSTVIRLSDHPARRATRAVTAKESDSAQERAAFR